MKYKLDNPNEVTEAQRYLDTLIERKNIVEIKKVSKHRTLSQNAYLHLLISAFGAHFGYTNEEAKQIYKEINATIYAYTKNNRTFYRSSADLTKDEMMKTIDKFRDKSAEAGYPLPLATDQAWLLEIENAIERSERYL